MLHLAVNILDISRGTVYVLWACLHEILHVFDVGRKGMFTAFVDSHVWLA